MRQGGQKKGERGREREAEKRDQTPHSSRGLGWRRADPGKERLKHLKHLGVDKVVVDDVDEKKVVVDVLDDGAWLGSGLIQGRPLVLPQSKRLILPDRKGGRIHDGGLNHLFAGEDAPRHSVWRRLLDREKAIHSFAL